MAMMLAHELFAYLENLNKQISDAEAAGDFSAAKVVWAQFDRACKLYQTYHLARQTELTELMTG
jgi:hypothetical protein